MKDLEARESLLKSLQSAADAQGHSVQRLNQITEPKQVLECRQCRRQFRLDFSVADLGGHLLDGACLCAPLRKPEGTPVPRYTANWTYGELFSDDSGELVKWEDVKHFFRSDA